MNTLTQIQALLQANLPLLKQKYPVDSLGIFGSYSRGDQTEESDIDILIDYHGKMGYNFIELAEELERITGKKVDLVSKKALKPSHWNYLKKQIIYV